MTDRKTGKRKKGDDGNSQEEKHCFCESRDYSTLMICCDYCQIWYHTKCIGITKAEVDRIESYACKKCQKKDKKTIYKKKEVAKTSKRKASIENASNDKKQRISTNNLDTNKVKKEGENEEKEQKDLGQTAAGNRRKKSITTGTAVKTEVPDPSLPGTSVASSQGTSHPQPAISSCQARNQKLQEEYPELRCKNCIGCFRDKDCGKCANCLGRDGKLCMNRVCVQVEELFKQKLVKIETTDDGDSTEQDAYRTKKGRKPKQVSTLISQEKEKEGTAEPQRKRRNIQQSQPAGNEEVSIVTQLKNFYQGWTRGKQRGKKLPPELEEKQCIGPGCTSSVRSGSKYCSEQCGLEMAQLRLKNILPQRVNDYFGQIPANHLIDRDRLQQLETQVRQMECQLKQLQDWKDNLHNFIGALKNSQPAAEQQRNEDESMMVGCPVCAGEFSFREITKHTQSCFMRSERQTTYGTDYQVPNNQYDLYCDAYNKINKTYCKRLRYACAEHYKDEYEHVLKICGCPLSWNKGNSSVPFDELFQSPDVMMMANGGYCQEKRKACKDHPNWIQTAFSLIDNERMNVMNKMEEAYEQSRATLDSIRNRGDILSLLCNKTISSVAVTIQIPRESSLPI